MAGDSRELHPDVVRFIEERIDTVPHLEALLLLWESGSERWTAQQTAARLYVSPAAAASILDDLVRRQLVRSEADGGHVYYSYQCLWDPDGEQLARVSATYRRHTVLVASRRRIATPGRNRWFLQVSAGPIKKRVRSSITMASP